MGRSAEVSAKTIDAAIEEAVEKLGVSQDDVDIEIISSGGMFKKAKVKATVKDGAEKEKEKAPEKPKPVVQEIKQVKEEKPAKEKPAKETTSAPKTNESERGEQGIKFTKTYEFVKELIRLLGNDSVVTGEMGERGYDIKINGENVGVLIGKGGEVLNALQVLVSSIAISNANGEGKRVYVNIEDYKERREASLKSMAIRKAEQVKETGRYIKLEPMNARDRAIIHTAVAEISGIRTYSTGKEPFRCLCIATAESKE